MPVTHSPRTAPTVPAEAAGSVESPARTCVALVPEGAGLSVLSERFTVGRMAESMAADAASPPSTVERSIGPEKYPNHAFTARARREPRTGRGAKDDSTSSGAGGVVGMEGSAFGEALTALTLRDSWLRSVNSTTIVFTP